MFFRDFWESSISTSSPMFRALLFDVDGTIVSGRKPMNGANELLRDLRSYGMPFFFLTNDSHHSSEQKAALMKRAGVDVYSDEIISCSHALELFVRKNSLSGSLVFIMGEFGTPCFAEAAGLQPCRDLERIDECSFVIAGEGYFDWHDTFQAVMNYFIRHPERHLVVPNPDSYWPEASRGRFGIGAGAQARFIAGILTEMNINIKIDYLGKPHELIFNYALERLETKYGLNNLRSNEVIMLGDALFSDIAGARRAGLRSALVMTGVTTLEMLDGLPAEDSPDWVFEAIAAE